ncbi:MAG TPA: DUF4870 domain-containing protein [Dongiaceae bacterium]|jgi:uncharacterized membrane protein|nr:DUF4870 domain-containing protein [Dongiaceae bacterium]
MVQDPNQSSFGLAPNVAAGLASLFSWVGGLVILLGKPPQAWVRFVAVQSIVLAIVYVIIQIAYSVLSIMLGIAHLGAIALILWPVDMLIGLAFFVFWLIATIQAFQGKAYRIPVVSGYADRWVPASASL